jgi:hypothetical protein
MLSLQSKFISDYRPQMNVRYLVVNLLDSSLEHELDGVNSSHWSEGNLVNEITHI